MVAFADRKFEIMGRDVDWRFISNNEQHVGMACIHFGGDPNVRWKIDMVRIFLSYFPCLFQTLKPKSPGAKACSYTRDVSHSEFLVMNKQC